MAAIWILVVLGISAGIYLCMVAPRGGGRARFLRGRMYAHRGLHGQGAVENSREAFARAMEAGLGIELDVRLSSDGEVMVFHDADLLRVCGREGTIEALSREELSRIPLGDGRIPTLREALEWIDGRVPLLVEIKNCREIARVCRATYALLREYPGEYVVESFNPLALRWFRRRAPEVIRGQLVAERREYASKLNALGAQMLCAMLANVLSRPDFVAYEIRREQDLSIRLMRNFFRIPLAAWTVCSQPDLERVLARGEAAIFETGHTGQPIQFPRR